ncbi:MAG: 50S ribosomal protein L19, partial [Victivallales bacterium]|nr:50S ribosomal protein L19 [Victivallales bacterium]
MIFQRGLGRTRRFEMANIMDKINSEQCGEMPEFNIGDTVSVHTKIVEGDAERIQ